MRRTAGMALVVGLLAVAVGCRNNTEGPREVYQKTRAGDRADRPGYTLDEQKQRGRERYSIIEDDREIGPKTFSDRPGGVGR